MNTAKNKLYIRLKLNLNNDPNTNGDLIPVKPVVEERLAGEETKKKKKEGRCDNCVTRTKKKKRGDVVKTKPVGRPTTSGSPSSWSVSIKDRSIVYRRPH